MKLLIAVCSCRGWEADFGPSLIELLVHLHARMDITTAHVSSQSQVSLLSKGRQNAVDSAIADNYDYLLMIDDDMIFKKEAFEILLSRNEDFVAANYVRKKSSLPVTQKNAAFVFSKDQSGIEQITNIGLGLALMKVSALRLTSKPHFEVLWSDALNDYEGEDTYFCTKLAKAGVSLYVDHDATRYVAHIGSAHYQEPFTKKI